MSLVLRPTLDPAQAQRATMICSLGAVEAARRVAGLSVQVKWPNDLVIAGRKVGGILTELGAEGKALTYVVVGMGINVNLDASLLPEVMVPATSLMAEAGIAVSRVELLCCLLEGRRSDDTCSCARVGHPTRSGARTWPPWARRCVWARPMRSSRAMPSTWIPMARSSCRARTAGRHRVLAGDVTLRGHRL